MRILAVLSLIVPALWASPAGVYAEVAGMSVDIRSKAARAEKIPPKVAGSFYPSDPGDLTSQLERYFFKVPGRKVKPDPVAIWVPHAGYRYSGQVAATAYYEVQGRKYDNIILIGPSHYVPIKVASIYPSGTFMTPIGDVRIDEELAKAIADKLPEAEFNAIAYAREHSLETQLPFMRRVFPDVPVVQILTGPMDYDANRRLAAAIVQATRGRKILLVASSDMSHYPNASDANNVDTNSLAMVQRFDAQLLPAYTGFFLNAGFDKLETLFCGDGALLTVMEAARMIGANECRILNYANSAEAGGDRNRVVGYGAAAFFYDENKGVDRGQEVFLQGEEGRNEMLSLARNSIENYLAKSSSIKLTLNNPEYFRPAHVFVTLNKQGKLRGCIGNPVERLPLYEAIVRMANAAAFRDRRFDPLRAEELKDVKLKISVLGNFRRVEDAREIEMGKHGVMVRKGRKQGLFLPEVAEQIPDKTIFLRQLCSEKAQLPQDAWQDPDTELWVFQTMEFSE